MKFLVGQNNFDKKSLKGQKNGTAVLRTHVSIALFGALFFGPAFSQTGVPQFPSEKSPELSDTEEKGNTAKVKTVTNKAGNTDPEATGTAYQVSTSANGLQVVSFEDHKVPLVTIVLAARAGGMTETALTNGLTHLWEHMFFKGNKRIPNQEAFNKRIRQLGIVFNGDTSAEKVRYYFTLPSVFLEEGLQFMADAIGSPLLEQEELEKERRVVLDEYDRSAAQPGFDFRNLSRLLIYGDQDYQRDPLGRRHLISKATREQLFQIKDEVFVPANSALFVAGDFNQSKLLKLVSKHFKDWKTPKDWQPIKRPDFPDFPKTQTIVMTRPLVENAEISLTFQGPKAKTRPQDSFAADVLISLLSHRSGKFYQKYIDSGLTFGAGLSYYTQSQAGEVGLFASVDPVKAKKVQTMLIAEPKEWLKEDYFTNEQLEDVRRSLSIDHLRQLSKPSEYAKTLAFWWAVTDLDYYGSYLASLKSTTLADVRKFVQRYLINQNYLGGILVSPEGAKVGGLKDNSQPLVEKYLSNYESGNPTESTQSNDPSKPTKDQDNG